MATITVDIDDALLKAVRKRAESEDMTLDDAIRCSLAEYARPQPPMSVEEALAFLDELDYVRMGDRRPTRDEMNAR